MQRLGVGQKSPRVKVSIEFVSSREMMTSYEGFQSSKCLREPNEQLSRLGYFLLNNRFFEFVIFSEFNKIFPLALRLNQLATKRKMRPRRPNRILLESFVIFALLIDRSLGYGTPNQGNFMSAVKTLIFGNETVGL